MTRARLEASAISALVVLLLAAAAQVFPIGVAAIATAAVAVRRRRCAMPWARLAVVLELAFLTGMSAHCTGAELWSLASESPWAVASRHLPAAFVLLLLTSGFVVALVAMLCHTLPTKSQGVAARCSYLVDGLNQGEV